jgi:hypothetical protein
LHSVVTRFLKTYRGSAFPTLAELASGEQVIIKLRGAGNGAESLLSEYIVNRLAHLAGLPVPDASIVSLPDDFPWEYGTDEFHDLVMKSPGANLALTVIPRAQPLAPDRHAELPAHFISQVVTLDRTFSNWDRTPASGNLLTDTRGQLWIVDHGSCRFLHEGRLETLPALPPNHCFSDARDSFDASWLDLLDAAAVQAVAADIPEIWLRETRRTRAEIVEGVNTRLAAGRQRVV